MVDSEPRQENIMIGGVEVPIIYYEDEVWYPANYIHRYLFNKPKSQKMITKENEHKFYNTVRVFNINFGFYQGGIQCSKCINKVGIDVFLRGMNIGKLNPEQRKSYNALINYLKLDITLLLEKDTLSKIEIENIIKNYNPFIQDCINAVLEVSPDIKWRKCDRCSNIYPIHQSFFSQNANKHSNFEFMNFCKECGQVTNNITHINDEINNLYRKYGEEFYNYYTRQDTIGMYEYCRINNIDIPKIIKNKSDYLKIIKYVYDKGYVDKNDLTLKMLEESFNLSSIDHILKIYDVYLHLFGEDYWQYPWRYKKLSLTKLTYSQGKTIFYNYINEFNIKIDDIFNFDYGKVIHKARLTQLETDTLDFVVYLYDRKYPGYKFKTYAVNYYKKRENRIFDLKYLIEEDLKIPLDKIPLYLTKMTLQRNCRSLYQLLYKGKYYSNLYEWVNEIYPNKYIESDFTINTYRNEFDSEEEGIIDELLHKTFRNVIYNQRNTSRTITIDNMIPDWLVFTNNECWLIEYFGLFVDRVGNTRINDYRNKTISKIEKYNKLSGYKFLALFPEDLKENYKGVFEKLNTIV